MADTKKLQVLGTFGGTSLPEVSESDNGKILGVVNGEWGAIPIALSGDYPEYAGEYEITPTVDGQTMATAQKVMREDVTIKAIPYYDVSNTAGGSTVFIADEIEFE